MRKFPHFMRWELHEIYVKTTQWSAVLIGRIYVSFGQKVAHLLQSTVFLLISPFLKAFFSRTAHFISLSEKPSSINDTSYLSVTIPSLCMYVRVCTSYVKGLNGMHFKRLGESFVVVLNIEQGNKKRKRRWNNLHCKDCFFFCIYFTSIFTASTLR